MIALHYKSAPARHCRSTGAGRGTEMELYRRLFGHRTPEKEKNGDRDCPLYLAVRMIRTDKLPPSPYDNAGGRDRLAVFRLAESLRGSGVILPLLVKLPDSGRGDTVIIDGNKRLSAARLAGITELPCLPAVCPAGAERGYSAVLSLCREDTDIFSEYSEVLYLTEECGMTEKQAAALVCRPLLWVSDILSLGRITEREREIMLSAGMGLGHAKAFLTMPEGDKRYETIARAAQQQLTPEQCTALAAASFASAGTPDAQTARGGLAVKEARLVFGTVSRAAEELRLAGTSVTTSRHEICGGETEIRMKIRMPV